MIETLGFDATVRGRGLIIGVEFTHAALADRVSKACFERGLIVETAGIDDQVLKLLPSLTISHTDLDFGLDIIEESMGVVKLTEVEVKV
jgi:diaminobutyrate-2-oxoglutarate transaminase